jgi:hypothetical protein
LSPLGFTKRADLVFTSSLAPSVLGWVGLNTASKHLPSGVVAVNPVVGVRHQALEGLLAQLLGEPAHRYLPPTISTPLGYLMPERTFMSWPIDTRPGSIAGIHELGTAIAESGLPFMVRAGNLEGLRRLLDEGYGPAHQTALRLPLARLLSGDEEGALATAHRYLDGLGDRTDPAAAAYRRFADSLGRYLRTPSRPRATGDIGVP